MAGDVSIVYEEDSKEHFPMSQHNKERYGNDILCKVCKHDKGGKCHFFQPPNRDVYVCNKFEKK